MKKIIIITILIVFFAALPLSAEQIDYPGNYGAGDPITAAGMNTRFSLVYNLLNGNLDADNIKDGTIVSDDLASDADSLFKVSGGALMSTGSYIGIGTDSPAGPLQINHTASVSPFMIFRNSENRALMILGPSNPEDYSTPWTFYSSNAFLWSLDSVDAMSIDFARDVYIGAQDGTNTDGGRLTITRKTDYGIGGSLIIFNPSEDEPETTIFMGRSYHNRGMRFHQISGYHGQNPALYIESQTDGEGFNPRMSIFHTGEVGINTVSPAYTLHVAGSAYCTSGSWTASDARYKENITPIQSSLERLSKIDGVNFTWKPEFQEELHVSDGSHIGLIAQVVEKEFPELVNTDPTGYKAVAYDKFTAVLLQAIKEQQVLIEDHQVLMENQQSLIEAQQEQIDEMREKLNRLLE